MNKMVINFPNNSKVDFTAEGILGASFLLGTDIGVTIKGVKFNGEFFDAAVKALAAESIQIIISDDSVQIFAINKDNPRSYMVTFRDGVFSYVLMGFDASVVKTDEPSPENVMNWFNSSGELYDPVSDMMYQLLETYFG